MAEPARAATAAATSEAAGTSAAASAAGTSAAAAETSAEAAAISDPLRVGLVGCGRLAEVGYGPAFARSRSARLVAVADPNAERCRRTAPDLPAFPSVRDLIADGVVEAIVVATPVASHVEIAMETARAGLPALVEKPPARSAAEARRLAKLDPPPRIGFNRRFEGALADLRGGIPATGELDLRLEFDRRGNWASYGGNDPVLLDIGPHAFDLVRWFARAEIASVRAREHGKRVTVELDLADGRGRARVEVRMNRPFREELTIRAGGSTIGRHHTGGIVEGVLGRIGPGRESPLVPSLTRQLDAFAAAVQGEHRDDLGTVDDALAVMAAVDAARTSAAAGGTWKTIGKETRESSRSFSSTR